MIALPVALVLGLGDGCLACHPEASSHTAAWLASRHRRAGVGCATCHPAAPPRPPFEPEGVIDLCGGCHREVRRLFETGRFFRDGHRRAGTPTCITCHDDTGSRTLTPAEVSTFCRRCHAKGENGDIPARAEGLLRRLQEVTLARILVEQRAARLRDAWPESMAKRLDRVRRLVGDPILEWHRFDLDAVERSTALVLDELEEVEEWLDAHED